MKIILLYGGRSEEHDVSVLSAYSVLNAIYYKYYQVQLVFISKDGQWVKGPLLSERPQNKEVLHLTWAQTPEETGDFQENESVLRKFMKKKRLFSLFYMGQMVKMEQFKDSWKPLICLMWAQVS